MCRDQFNTDDCETIEGGSGVPDADFVVFVTAEATSACQGSTGAHAVHCETDTLNWCDGAVFGPAMCASGPGLQHQS